jgi:hypothetical protein
VYIKIIYTPLTFYNSPGRCTLVYLTVLVAPDVPQMEHEGEDTERGGHRADDANGGHAGIDKASTPQVTGSVLRLQLHRTAQVSFLYATPRLYAPQISMMRAISPEKLLITYRPPFCLK